MTKIEWVMNPDGTQGERWNPIVGCTIATPGCTNCYAMRAAWRMSHNPATPQYHGTVKMVNGNPVWTGKMALAEKVLTAPLHRKKPTTCLVNSMGDLFHENVPDEWIDRVFAVMALCPQHRFQILTKRAARMRAYFARDDDGFMAAEARIEHRAKRIARESGSPIPVGKTLTGTMPWPNVWLGVSVEDQRRADERIPDLLATPATIRFVSAEPLLGPVNFLVTDARGHDITALRGIAVDPTDPDGADEYYRTNKIDWVIVGGESGRGARPMHPDWARDIRDQCVAADVQFFFKQWGSWIPFDQKVETSLGIKDVDDAFDIGDAAERNILHLWDDEDGAIPLRKKAAGRILDGREWSQMPK